MNSRAESQRSISSAFQMRPDAHDPENLVLSWAVKVLDDVESTLISLHAILKEIKVQQSQSDVDPRVIDGMLRLQEIEDAFIAGGGLQFPSVMRHDLDRVLGRFDRLELQIHSAKADLQRETKSIDERLSALELGGGFMVIRPFPALIRVQCLAVPWWFAHSRSLMQSMMSMMMMKKTMKKPKLELEREHQ